MKRLTVTLVLIIIFNCFPQADLSIEFLMYDNAIPPNNGSWELTFGLDSTATDGIDQHLGEYPIPPDVCCGWGGPILCGWFDLPSNPNGVWIDYRFGELPYTGVKEHRISYCSDPSSTEVTIQCSLPLGVTAILQDVFGGILFNIAMIDSNEYHIYDPYIGIDMRFAVTYNNVVPVELISFNGLFLNSSVQLNWTTATEPNNSGFEILKQKSGVSSQESECETIGFIPGFGTTTEPKSYSFIDENVTSGIYKYRLKQIDFDGSFEYSNEIEVEVDFTPKEFVLYQNYPNPFNPKTVISYQLPVSGNVTLKVYDILGNEIATLVNEEKQPGVYEVEFNLASGIRNPASGIYFYKIIAGEFTQTSKMILLR